MVVKSLARWLRHHSRGYCSLLLLLNSSMDFSRCRRQHYFMTRQPEVFEQFNMIERARLVAVEVTMLVLVVVLVVVE